ncbi:phage holin [Diplocloster agilis]|nr:MULTISPECIES: phage holin [Lachnospiraceae]MCU6733344.1 phage holin [Suonthocola fibrivorans]SCI88085.1 Small integral membrane protein [uncultured Clostridium sp.]
MKINWKVRLKNKTFVIAFSTAVVAFIYQLLALLGITPAVAQNDIITILSLLVNMLAGLGILIDPTTKGVQDSGRALTYEEPN